MQITIDKNQNGQESKANRKRLKWNWGTKIALAFVLFCSFILFMVVRAFQQNVDLVSDTYYLDELAYQTRIDERNNLAQSGLEIGLDQSQAEVILTFPEPFKEASGAIYFYHPSRKLFDKQYAIALNEDNRQVILKDALVKGRFKVRINWTVDNTPYFQEKEIFLR